MKFYIASRLDNHRQVRFLAERLQAHGWIHTYDWTKESAGQVTDIETLRGIGMKELEGVKNADRVIVLTPQGRGTHTELGMAIALQKGVYIYHTDDTFFQCDDRTSTFYWLPQVKHVVGEIEDLVIELIGK